MIGNSWEWCEIGILRGGSCSSDEKELNYKVKHLINYEYDDDMGFTGYKKITGQGTSFRVAISAE